MLNLKKLVVLSSMMLLSMNAFASKASHDSSASEKKSVVCPAYFMLTTDDKSYFYDRSMHPSNKSPVVWFASDGDYIPNRTYKFTSASSGNTAQDHSFCYYRLVNGTQTASLGTVFFPKRIIANRHSRDSKWIKYDDQHIYCNSSYPSECPFIQGAKKPTPPVIEGHSL